MGSVIRVSVFSKEWESGSTAETAYINLDNSCPAQHLPTKGIAATYTANYGMWLVCWSGCGSD